MAGLDEIVCKLAFLWGMEKKASLLFSLFIFLSFPDTFTWNSQFSVLF